MVDTETKEKIMRVIDEETQRMEFGKLFVEITIDRHRALNIQVETRRSVKLLDNQK